MNFIISPRRRRVLSVCRGTLGWNHAGSYTSFTGGPTGAIRLDPYTQEPGRLDYTFYDPDCWFWDPVATLNHVFRIPPTTIGSLFLPCFTADALRRAPLGHVS